MITHDVPVHSVLNAMEAMHRRILAVGWSTVAATLSAYLWLAHVAQTSTDVRRVIMAAVLALTCLIAWTTFALAVIVVRTGRRILRMLDLVSSRVGPE
jgi:hypothetical protein